MKLSQLFFLLVISLLFSCSENRISVQIENELIDAPVKHAIQKFQEQTGKVTFQFSASNPNWIISTALDTLLGAEAYQVKTSGKKLKVTGGNGVGVMYGLLYIKEQLVEGKTEIQPIEEKPRFAFRALKFNLPWDSYRNGEALQLHTETCKDTNFWHSFLDMMAENRFNKLTLWNLHPFNYLVKTQKYPEACGFSDQEMAEWQKFWKSLFRMAKDRVSKLT